MTFEEFITDLPQLHSWDGGKTWNTGGFGEEHLRPLIAFLREQLPERPSIIETGAGCSTIAFLFLNAARIVSIAPDDELYRRIADFCDERRLPTSALEIHTGFSEWVLPELARPADQVPWIDFALIDGGHGWPTPFVDFFYINHMLRPGGYLMVDDVQLASVAELEGLLSEQPGFERVLDLGKSIVFRKTTADRGLPDWTGQPYIVRRTDALASPAPSLGRAEPMVATKSDQPTTLRGTYDRAFFAEQADGSVRSAAVMIPRILELLPETASVVDLGCGTGAWLHQFKAAGIKRVLGLDGGASDDGALLLERHEFRNADFAQPLPSFEKFDLALSVEVAEHLPPDVAPVFVANLCGLSDVVVFSAAVPGQSGTYHINERWQSYWVSLFEAEGFAAFDVLRPQTWYDHRVEWWYAQNIMVFAHRARVDVIERLTEAAARLAPQRPWDLIHPRCFEAFRRSLEMHRATSTSTPGVTSGSPATSAEARAAAAEAQLAAILHSTSWRVTGPIRRAFEHLPGIRRQVRRIGAPIWRTSRGVARRLSGRP